MTDDAVLGNPLTWAQALPLVRALRDIAQQSTNPTAAEVATGALHEVFPGKDGLEVMFGRVPLETSDPPWHTIEGCSPPVASSGKTDEERSRDFQAIVRASQHSGDTSLGLRIFCDYLTLSQRRELAEHFGLDMNRDPTESHHSRSQGWLMQVKSLGRLDEFLKMAIQMNKNDG